MKVKIDACYQVYPSSRGVDAYTTAIGKNRKEVIIIYGGTSISGKVPNLMEISYIF